MMCLGVRIDFTRIKHADVAEKPKHIHIFNHRDFQNAVIHHSHWAGMHSTAMKTPVADCNVCYVVSRRLFSLDSLKAHETWTIERPFSRPAEPENSSHQPPPPRPFQS